MFHTLTLNEVPWVNLAFPPLGVHRTALQLDNYKWKRIRIPFTLNDLSRMTEDGADGLTSLTLDIHEVTVRSLHLSLQLVLLFFTFVTRSQ